MVDYFGGIKIVHTKISNPMDYKVALYIRLSKEDNAGRESESVKNQRSMLQNFSMKHKLNVFSEYVEMKIPKMIQFENMNPPRKA